MLVVFDDAESDGRSFLIDHRGVTGITTALGKNLAWAYHSGILSA